MPGTQFLQPREADRTPRIRATASRACEVFFGMRKKKNRPGQPLQVLRAGLTAEEKIAPVDGKSRRAR